VACKLQQLLCNTSSQSKDTLPDTPVPALAQDLVNAVNTTRFADEPPSLQGLQGQTAAPGSTAASARIATVTVSQPQRAAKSSSSRGSLAKGFLDAPKVRTSASSDHFGTPCYCVLAFASCTARRIGLQHALSQNLNIAVQKRAKADTIPMLRPKQPAARGKPDIPEGLRIKPEALPPELEAQKQKMIDALKPDESTVASVRSTSRTRPACFRCD
jgi:hypothetical protein